ncbi:putative PH domain containing protein [Blattamonas nauphoetae]|uniref:PH domain containing protein n=1 Tax=Blattamonas nauphoetae TaxID=2049346 RepID=A0ABQ9X5A8_9EUKA|nr:putative PH domain containing protein [Blattamonas nauphoetae]
MTTTSLRAQYDFNARVSGELSFKVGDIITLIEKNDSGMWIGSLNGDTGLFPYNFVAEITEDSKSNHSYPERVEAHTPVEGWLTKQGHFRKNWKRRWFTLQGNTLHYSEKPNSPKELGTISLKGTSIKSGESVGGSPFTFHLFQPNNPSAKEFYLRADDVNQMNAWVTAILRASS